MSEMERHFVDVIRALRPGEVVSYGDVADDAGFHGRSRAVGHLLAATDQELPWWRVVTSTGRLVPGHELDQAEILRSEGVTVLDARVRRAKYGRFAVSERATRRLPP